MKDIYELLFEIEERYYMYTGGYDIFRLHSFLDGYRFARRELGLEESEQEKDFRHFHGWLRQKYNLRTNNSWSNIIFFLSIDERRDVESFYRLLKEFINRDKTSENDFTDKENNTNGTRT